MRVTDEFDQLILAAACDDFTTLECLADKLLRPAEQAAGMYDAGNLQSRLLKLISDRLINAYLLHAEPPYITPVDVGYDALGSSWFYVSQRGRKCLNNTCRKQDAVRGRDAASDQGSYTSAVNF